MQSIDQPVNTSLMVEYNPIKIQMTNGNHSIRWGEKSHYDKIQKGSTR
jgi:hypothetical protein